jgi:allantoinase
METVEQNEPLTHVERGTSRPSYTALLPYLMKVGDKRFYTIPYSAEINDKTAVEFHHVVPEEFDRMIRRQFDELYREGAQSGRVMASAPHPYIRGVLHRIDALYLA